MIEYLYDAIRAVAGQEFEVNAIVTHPDETLITEGCCFMLHSNEDMVEVPGTFLEENGMWSFIVPASATVGMKGKYWYCIQHNNSNLCFMQPIYLV